MRWLRRQALCRDRPCIASAAVWKAVQQNEHRAFERLRTLMPYLKIRENRGRSVKLDSENLTIVFSIFSPLVIPFV